MKKFLLFILILLSSLFFVGCFEKKIEKPILEIGSFTYTGEEISINIQSNEIISVSGNKATDAGTYTAVVTIINKDKFKWMDKTKDDLYFTWTIERAKIDKPSTPEELTFIYNTNKQSLNIEENSLYTINNNEGTNVNNYQTTVSINDKLNYEWNDGTQDDIVFDWQIVKQKVNKPSTPEELSFVYNTNKQSLNIEENSLYTISDNEGINVNTYHTTVSLNDKLNYEWNDGTQDDIVFDWEIVKQKVNKPNTPEELTFVYNTNKQCLNIEENSLYTINNNEGINVNTYHTIVSLNDKENYEWEDDSTDDIVFAWEIVKKKVNKPNTPEELSFVYNTNKQSLNIEENSLYTISDNEGINVNTYHTTVSLNDKLNYEWNDGTQDDIVFDWQIVKQKVEKLEIPSQLSFVYDAKEVSIDLSSTDLVNVSGDLKQTNAGAYSIIISLNDKANYEWEDNSIDDVVINWYINKDKVYKPTINGNSTFIYNTFKQGVSISTSELYTVGGSIEEINVGNYTAIVSLNDKANYEWEDSTTDDFSLSWCINKCKVNKPNTPEELSFVYNTNKQSLTIEESSLYTISYNEGTNAGNYTSIVSLNDKANYEWADSTIDDISFNWNIEKAVVDVPSVDVKTFTYDGTSKSLVIDSSSYYAINNNEGINANSYETTLSLKDGANYKWNNGNSEDVKIAWIINKATITLPVLFISQYVYSGNEIDVYSNADQLFTHTGNTGKELGNYQVIFTINDKNNYTWNNGSSDDYSIDWSITTNAGAVSLPTIETTYNENYFNYNDYSNNIYTISGASIKDAGTYQATISLNNKEVNTWLDKTTEDKTITITIDKATFDVNTLSFDSLSIIYDKQSHSLSINGYIPNDINVIYSNNSFINVGTYDITASLELLTNNYNEIDKTYTATLTINKATFDMTNISLNDSTITYDGYDHELLITGALDNEISAVYTNNTQKYPGTYAVSVSFETSDNYNSIDTVLNANMSIVKGDFDYSTITFEDVTYEYDGNEHELTYSGFVPEGITIKMFGNRKGTNIGDYTGQLIFQVTNTNYFNNNLSSVILQATMHIVKGNIDISSISFEDTEVYYDKTEHELVIIGDLPTGVTSVQYLNNKLTGTYNTEESIEATLIFYVDLTHYNSLDNITATLKVVPKKVNITINNLGSTQTVETYRYTKLSDIDYQLRRNGYNFDGYIDSESNSVSSEIEVLDDMNLTTTWVEKTYHVSFKLNGGSFTEALDEDYTIDVVYNSNYTLPSVTNSNEYTFLGWYDAKNNYNTAFTSGTWTYSIGEETNVELQAIWNYNGDLTDEFSFNVGTSSIEVTFNNLGSGINGFAYLYAMNPGVYYSSDTQRGLSTSVYSNFETYVIAYKCGTKLKLSFNRFTSSGVDLYTQKFYLAFDNTIVKGPIWCSDVESDSDVSSQIAAYNTTTKKGLVDAGEYFMYWMNLGSVASNAMLNNVVLPNELVASDGTVTELDWENNFQTSITWNDKTYTFDESDYVAHTYNGKTYFINVNGSTIASLDSYALTAYQQKAILTTIFLTQTTTDQFSVPYYMQYPGAGLNTSVPYMQVNTSNEKGADYFGAIMDFISSRYSGPTHGIISYYVIGNEVDLPDEWNSLNNSALYGLISEANFQEEYYREVRIASMIIRKHNNYGTALLSFSHCWNDYPRGWYNCYNSYKMSEYVIRMGWEQGNFYWGITSHSYPISLSSTNVFYDDTVAGDVLVSAQVNTTEITPTNLEVYDLYFDRAGYYMPNGDIRPVVANEIGISTGYYKYTAGSNLEVEYRQAATIAYLFYKTEMLKSFKGFNYFTLNDTDKIPAATFGLFDGPTFNMKVSYRMYESIETKDTSTYTSYISYCNYYDRRTSQVTSFTSSDTYLSIIKTISASIGSNSIDWDTRWDQMTSRLGIDSYRINTGE